MGSEKESCGWKKDNEDKNMEEEKKKKKGGKDIL